VSGWIAWVAVGAVVWVTLAVLVAVLLGRTVRHRDRQVPHDAADAPVPPPSVPAERPVPEHRPRP
jgi:hypothetical protein